MSKNLHEEHRMENSLTTPEDRDPSRNYKPNQSHPPLTEDEVSNAIEDLDNSSFIRKYPSVERKYADPVEPLQRVGLISFVPAKGATPNSSGVYGFAKLRGNYPTDLEASERAELLIRTTDSYHQIYHAFVGRPFPCTLSSKYSDETTEIDIRKSMTESISASIKNKKKSEGREVQEIEEREKQLLEESKRDSEDPIEHYTTLRVKKAQVTWTYLETLKKIEEMKATIITTRKQIEEIDKESPEYADQYFKKYCDARSASGLDNSANKDTFMAFLVEETPLDF
jgi:hypothetical protein